jgi:murein DD-endopeptidase MepM/ murein hydrolase activator NlpD
MEDSYRELVNLFKDIKLFFAELSSYLISTFHLSFLKFEERKGVFVSALYRQRGKMARSLIHSGMAGLAGVAMVIAPVVAKEFPGRSVNPWDLPDTVNVLSAASAEPETTTLISEKARDKIIEYTVAAGDTVSSIAEKFGISQDTIRWQNNLATKASIKVGQTLQILPVTGVSHKVVKGDTVYSIAKYYNTSPQAIVDFPYNTFANDETFELAIGQVIIVPDGVKPAETVYWSPIAVTQKTPNAGTVVASGVFVWPVGGTITQRFVWYHQGIDIANSAAPDVLAADAGTILVPPFMYGGYGNYVIINHGNGYTTLYGHLQRIYVTSGQTVKRGDAIGKMGSTGRSTGTHLHFEVARNGVKLNPLDVLR